MFVVIRILVLACRRSVRPSLITDLSNIVAFVQTYGGNKFSVSDGRFSITRFLLLVDVDILSISLHVVAFIYVGWLTPRSDVPRKLSHAAIISPRFVWFILGWHMLIFPGLVFSLL